MNVDEFFSNWMTRAEKVIVVLSDIVMLVLCFYLADCVLAP